MSEQDGHSLPSQVEAKREWRLCFACSVSLLSCLWVGRLFQLDIKAHQCVRKKPSRPGGTSGATSGGLCHVSVHGACCSSYCVGVQKGTFRQGETPGAWSGPWSGKKHPQNVKTDWMFCSPHVVLSGFSTFSWSSLPSSSSLSMSMSFALSFV